jgi:hypothetical protein
MEQFKDIGNVEGFKGLEVPVPAPPPIPELFPGYKKQLEDVQAQAAAAEEESRRLRREQQKFIQEVAAKPLPRVPRPEEYTAAGLLRLVGKEELALKIVGGAEEDYNEQIRQLTLLVAAQNIIYERASWQALVMQALPGLIISGVENYEDLVGANLELNNPTPEDKVFVNTLIERLRGPLAGVPTTPDMDSQELIRLLMKPRGDLKKYLSIDSDQQSVEQIINSLAEAARFTPPPGVTNLEIRRILVAEGLTEDAAQFGTVREEAARIAEIGMEHKAYFAELHKMADEIIRGDVLSQMDKAKMAQALAQPGFLLLKPVEIYMKRVSRSTAGYGLQYDIFGRLAMPDYLRQTLDRAGRETNLTRALIGSETYDNYELILRQARQEGLGSWEAHSYAFEHWETNFFIKLILEVAYDPLSYFGFGLYTGLAKPFGRVGAAVGAFEQGYLRLAELPFKGATAIFAQIPKTLEQRAQGYSRAAFNALRTYLEQASGKQIGTLSRGEATDIIRVALEEVFTNPQSPSKAATVGRLLVGPRTIGADDVERLLQDMGIAKELNVDQLSAINKVLDLTDGQGVSKFLRPNEAVELILHALDVSTSPENIAIVMRFLTSTQAALRNSALRVTKAENTIGIMQNAMAAARVAFLASQKTAISNRRYQDGMISRMLVGLDNTVRMSWMASLDHAVTQPFARSYLLFAFYGPFNIAENIAKTFLAGANPFWRGMITRRNQLFKRAASKFQGIEGDLPLEITNISQYVPQMGDMPEDSARLLASGVRLTKKQRKEATQDMRGWVDRIFSPRWLKRLTGFDLSAEIGAAQRTHYTMVMYDKLLREQQSIVVREVNRVVFENTRRFDGVLSKAQADAYRQELTTRILGGDIAHIKNIVNDFTPEVVATGEVQNIMQSYPEISSMISDFVLRKSETGELWAKGAEGITQLFQKEVREIGYEMHFASTEYFVKHFKEVVDALIEQVPRNAEEVIFKINALDQTTDTFGHVIHSSLAALQAYGELQRNPTIKAQIYEQLWSGRIAPFIESGADEIARLATNIKSQIPQVPGLSAIEKERFIQLADQYSVAASLTRQARQAQRSAEFEFFNSAGSRYVPYGKGRDASWWGDKNAAVSKAWDDLDSEFILNQGKIINLKSSIEGLAFTTPINASKRPLIKADVAKLFGIAPAELSRNMYIPEVLALRGRKQFVSMVRNRAEIGAKSVNSTADDMGYTTESVGRVYDEVMFSLKNEPGGIAEDIAPLFMQLNSARRDLILLGTRKNALLDDNALSAIQSAVDNMAIDLTRGSRATVGDRARSKLLKGLFTTPGDRPRTNITTYTRDEAKELFGGPPPTAIDPMAAPSPTIEQALEAGGGIPAAIRERADLMRTSAPGHMEHSRAVRRTRNSVSRSIDAGATELDDALERAIDEGLNLGNLLGKPLRELRDALTEESEKSARRAQRVLARADELLDTAEAEAIERGIRLLRPPPTVEAGEPVQRGFSGPIGERLRAGQKETDPGFRRLIAEWTTLDTDVAPFAKFDFVPETARITRDKIGNLALTPEMAPYRQSIISELRESFGNTITVYRSTTGGRGKLSAQKGSEFTSVTTDPYEAIKLTEPAYAGTQRQIDAARIEQITISVDDVVTVGALIESELIIRRGVKVQSWQDIRRGILAETRRRFQLDFPDYEHQTAISHAMKAIFPFWGYEAHRFGFLPREALRHPGVYGGWGKYQDNTDQGYITIPGTGLDINPLRGTILMGGMRRLFMRDYPEFYDGFGGIAEVTDAVSRWGFYPGAPYAIIQAMFGARSGNSQLGEVLPASGIISRSTLGALTAAFPAQTELLRDVIFPDRFRDFLIANRLGTMGYEGIKLLEKRVAGQPLSDEEQTLWNGAARHHGVLSILLEQTALFRVRPEEKRQLAESVDRILAEAYGFPLHMVQDMRKNSINIEDEFGPMPPEVHKQINALEGWSRFAGASVALAPSELGKLQVIIREFWTTVANTRLEAKGRRIEMEASMRAGTNNMDDWLKLKRDQAKEMATLIEKTRAENPRYADVPMTLDERVAFAEKHGLPLPQFHATEELRQLYFANELVERYDQEVGAILPDWDSFFAYRHAVEIGAGKYFEEVEALNQLEDTPLDMAFKEANKTYFRPYYAVFDAVLSIFSPEHQKIILRHRRADTPEERREFEAVLVTLEGEEEAKLISTFTTKLRQVRENMRDIDPQLDAWLLFFKIVTSPRTPAAEELFKDLRAQHSLS